MNNQADEPTLATHAVRNSGELKTMIKFPAFACGEKTYDLSHLDPGSRFYTRPGDAVRPAEVFPVNVLYVQHCFSIELPTQGYDPLLVCRDGREERLFDVERWELSKQLAAIVADMMRSRCWHGGQNNL